MLDRALKICLVLSLAYNPALVFAREEPLAEDPAPSLAKASPALALQSNETLKETVRRLRREKKRQYKEMTRGFINKIITEESVTNKREFLAGDAKTLEECIERAIAVAIPAKTAQERIKLAKQRILKAARDLFAEGNLELEDRGGSLSGQAFTADSYHVRFRQPVFRGGNLWHTLQKERATLSGARAERDQIANDLIQKVSEAYFDSIRTKLALEDKEKMLAVSNDILSDSKKKWDQGIISEIEYLNVESEQSQLVHDVEQAREDYELITLELQKELGLDINEKIELAPFYDYRAIMAKASEKFDKERKGKAKPHSDLGETDQTLDDYIRLAYDNRPDLKMEVNRLRSSIMGKRAQVGKLLPQVNVTMDFGELAEAFTDTVDDPSHRPEWQFIAEVSWNLGGNTVKYTRDRDQNAPSVSQFQAGSGSTTDKHTFSLALLDNLEDVYRVKEAQVEILDQFVKLEEKEREVVREVKEAYYNFRRAGIQLDSEMKQVLYRERLAVLSKHKLEQNEIQASEYLMAEKDLSEEKSQFHKAMADYYVARVGLNRAVGIRGLLPVKEWE
ncbi:MAG: TolC family protein [Candidatus Omnitrophica bacterium]|nr:TolC family protein [Candidatus Omnitrophota bacterium]